ncbi:CMRF35-like molecule 1 isoform X1 [Embiotoca jacksoni]|uniref:CMRF35-like molecule 1 isoform X1 n=1 Tax=Embiotoca jacksoni TaxID=100190 RepID=UPI003704B14F
MMKTYLCACLLSVLTLVEMETLNITGHVGENVTFQCSEWNTWINVRTNVKYFCESPCTEEKHIIIKAALGSTNNMDRIQLVNKGTVLHVTFTNLKKTDSREYYCGVERVGVDDFIKVNLEVIDAALLRPTTPAETKTVASTVSFTVVNSFTMSSSNLDNINNLTAPDATMAGYAPFVIIGLVLITAILMVLLMLIRKMMKRKQSETNNPSVVSRTQEDTGESAGPDGVYQSLHLSMEDRNQVYSTLTPTRRSAGPDGVYEMPHPSTIDLDHVYSTLKPTVSKTDLQGTSVDTGSGFTLKHTGSQCEEAEKGVM